MDTNPITENLPPITDLPIQDFNPNPIIESIATWIAAQNDFVILVIYITLALAVIKLCFWLVKKIGKTLAIAIGIAYFLTSTAFGATIMSYIEKLNLG